MASISSASYCLFFFLLATLASLNFLPVLSSTEFDVGGTTTGWAVPDANNSRFYNLWASKNRFLLGDIISKSCLHSFMRSFIVIYCLTSLFN